ncbi:MAG: HAMP domain-containing histidine kinase [Clostridiales bacterium]|nr:HAMP domain-containing histidine kinase [Clostridiales bacterium]
MGKRFLGVMIFLALLIVCVTLGLYFFTARTANEKSRDRIVDVNEIENLMDSGESEKASEKLTDLAADLRADSSKVERDSYILVIGGVALLCLLIAGIVVFVTVLQPLRKIAKYTTEIAKGNTDIPLTYDRGSDVGEFSWAFDSMRKELNKARASEKEAIENNKTVIATLSHDIKTPIASIRAYAEGLEANLDSSPEKRAQYLQVIMKKSDEVSKVTNDLFLHSLSDMHRLTVENKDVEVSAFTEEAVRDLDPEGKEISFMKPGFTETIKADPGRLLQCIENLISNARKYAATDVEVYIEKASDENGQPSLSICVQDHGKGIPDEDMPFIFDKFYRGHNHGENPGSGLGLYIVKYLMGQMNGDIKLTNTPRGLLAKLVFPLPSR